MAKTSAASKGYRKQTAKKPYLSKKDIIWVCAILALVVIGAVLLFSYDDGALKVKDGKVVTDGDNWLIVDGSKVRGRTRYFKAGEIGDIEGYSRETGVSSADVNIPLYAFKPEAEGAEISEISVTTSHTAFAPLAQYASAAIGGTEGFEVTKAAEEVLGGQTCSYFIYTAASYEKEEDGNAQPETVEMEAGEAQPDAADAEASEAQPDAAEAEASEAQPDAAESNEAQPDAANAEASEAQPEVAEAGEAQPDAANVEAGKAQPEAADAEAGEAQPDANRFTKAINGYFDAGHDGSFVIHVTCDVDSADAYPSDEVLLDALGKAIAAITPAESK